MKVSRLAIISSWNRPSKAYSREQSRQQSPCPFQISDVNIYGEKWNNGRKKNSHLLTTSLNS